MSDTLEIFGREFTNVAGFKAKDENGNTLIYTRGGSGGGTITIEEIPNATGTTLQITTNGSGGGGSTPSLQTKSVSYTPTTSAQTATITADTGYDGLEQVNVSVGAIPSGYIIPSGTKTISANGTGIDVTNFAAVDVNVSSGGGTPSATQHSIYFEFSDSTNTTINAWYDNSFISDSITATTPTTYGSKTVTLAQLDGVTWYEYDPSETWETLYDGNVDWLYESNGNYPYCWISSLGSTPITVVDVYRVTYANTEYRCTAKDILFGGVTRHVFGNPVWAGGTDDGSGVPFVFIDYTQYGAWTGGLNVPNVNSAYYFKIERLVTS